MSIWGVHHFWINQDKLTHILIYFMKYTINTIPYGIYGMPLLSLRLLESEAPSTHAPSAMLRCTRTVPLTWYRRRWKSVAKKRPWPDRKSSNSELLIQNLGRLNLTRENFQETLKMLAEKGQPKLIIEAFAVAMQNKIFALNERDFTVGISTCGRSKLWQDACWLLKQDAKG